MSRNAILDPFLDRFGERFAFRSGEVTFNVHDICSARYGVRARQQELCGGYRPWKFCCVLLGEYANDTDVCNFRMFEEHTLQFCRWDFIAMSATLPGLQYEAFSPWKP